MSLQARPSYSAEFKAQAMELLALGKPVNQVAEELCVSSNILYSWCRSHLPQGTQGGSAGGRALGEDSVKAESLQDGTFIDAYDNARRKHSALAYQTPFQFESNLSQNN